MAQRLRRPLVVVAGIASLALVSLALLDLFSPALDISSCPSDNLSTVAATAREYMKREGSTLPADVEVFRRFMLQFRGHDYLYCNRSTLPLVWRPTGLTAPGRGVVLVMCPPGTHGVIRRYAWALVMDGTVLSYAMVRGHQVVVRGQAGF
jgi:hypothetical protein